MAIIQWNEGLSVHVDEIDRQHQQLVRLINDLNQAMKEGRGKDVLEDIITSLTDYTESHFSKEEHYFDEFRYPETTSHKQKHAYFSQRVSEFRMSFRAGRLGLSISVMNFLSEWLKSHIMGADKMYGPFFNERGLS